MLGIEGSEQIDQAWIKLERLERASCITTIAAIAIVAATIVLIGLASGRLISPIIPIGIFGSIILPLALFKIIDCWQSSIGKKYNVDVEEWRKEFRGNIQEGSEEEPTSEEETSSDAYG